MPKPVVFALFRLISLFTCSTFDGKALSSSRVMSSKFLLSYEGIKFFSYFAALSSGVNKSTVVPHRAGCVLEITRNRRYPRSGQLFFTIILVLRL